jgi:transcriptional regulator with XRE-family HTH domain
MTGMLRGMPRRVSSAGAAIRRTRVARGLSQRALAGDRYTPQYISLLETGRVRPSEKALVYIADRLGVSPGSLLDGDPRITKPVDATLLLAAERALEDAADALRKLRESLGTMSVAPSVQTSGSDPLYSGAGSNASRRTGGSARRRAQLGLHEAIEEVLRSEESPLAAAEIARRVTASGWTPPRSGHELQAQQVSARTSHPQYRQRFTRRDGRIGLVEWER